MFDLRRTNLWHRLRVCTAEECQWVFVDRSRPGTGRWCSMKACGNRAKNKTFREKRKSEAGM
ncbi:CGNR zinc finger domain-containing protein [Paenibacillus thiaminolyticus]|uniref:CGNR zinc finger domain-containing protein n=1 Tax=Paenibacillus thiaminolyticus TaxID=49283 RepID=UPI002175C635|nr:CGNR zinc finger domain-containing protein [Paenibacillus thiaminolyticus]